MNKLNTRTTRAAVAVAALAGVIAVAGAAPATASSGLLTQGSSGDDVTYLQEMLNEELSETHLVVDGKFGPATADAVTWFQTCAGIQVDGIVGPQTRAALEDNLNTRTVDEPCIRVAQ
jgi:peptidoglycan hydrolase-like protein with peptidoglycan-binding domain